MKQKSQRYPGVCAGSQRCECAAFLSLGLVGLVLMGSAVWNSARYAGAKDSIAQNLEAPYVLVQKAGLTQNTNLAARSLSKSNRPS